MDDRETAECPSIKSPQRGGSKDHHGPESSFQPFKAETLVFQCPRADWTQGRG